MNDVSVRKRRKNSCAFSRISRNARKKSAGTALFLAAMTCGSESREVARLATMVVAGEGRLRRQRYEGDRRAWLLRSDQGPTEGAHDFGQSSIKTENRLGSDRIFREDQNCQVR